jgi:hypothetical protein
MSPEMISTVWECNMQGMPSSISREPWSELKVADLLRPLAFGTSFEELAIFLIDKIAEKKTDFPRAGAERAPVFGARIPDPGVRKARRSSQQP